jgi:hypothetical protein
MNSLFCLTIPAQAGIYTSHGHPPEFILGPRRARTRGPVWTLEKLVAYIRRTCRMGEVRLESDHESSKGALRACPRSDPNRNFP